MNLANYCLKNKFLYTLLYILSNSEEQRNKSQLFMDHVVFYEHFFEKQMLHSISTIDFKLHCQL